MDSIRCVRSLRRWWTRWVRRKRVRTPTLLQMEAVECGAAALGIILGYYGRWTPLAELRRMCGVSRDGSTAAHILEAASQYGLMARAFSVELEAIGNLQCPYIVFWNFDHFLVVEGFRKGWVYLNDPKTGPRTVTLDEFGNAFTGVILHLEPGPAFRPGGHKPSTIRALRARLRGAGQALAYCVGAGLLLVLPGLVMPVLTQVFIDRLLIAGLDDWLRPLLLGMLATAAFRGIVQHLELRALRRLQLRFSTVMSCRFLWHLLHLPLNFYAQRYAGGVSQRLGLNDRVAKAMSGQLATTIIDASMMCIYAGVMLQYDVILTLIGLACAVVNALALQWIARRRIDINMRNMLELDKMYGVSIAGIQQIETLKASALESDFFTRWASVHASMINAQQTLGMMNQTLSILPTFLIVLASAFVLIIGSGRVMDGSLSIGMLIAFQSLMQSFLAPVTRLIDSGATLQELQTSLYQLDDVLNNPALPEAEPVPNQHLITPKTFRLQGEVQVHHVTFHHSPVSPPIIEDVSFSLTPGKRVALVGSSGSGKSTLVKLVCGLYEPTAGEIRCDGVPWSQVPRAVRTHSIAMVDQDIAFFAGTLRENLTLWDATVADHQLIQACKDAVVHDVIMATPGGYDSLLLEGGVNLSGGERQRLEIARVLVNDPAVLILDEATSALDAAVELRILENLCRRGCASLIVAHRLSTIRDCDEIIVLDGGRVVQQGPHDHLVWEEGPYRHLLGREAESLASQPRLWSVSA